MRLARPSWRQMAIITTLSGASLVAIGWFGKLPPNPQRPSHFDDELALMQYAAPNQIGDRQQIALIDQFTPQDLSVPLQNLSAAHPGQSGVYPLNQGMDAFVARLLMIATAQKTLDLQYYIWENDVTGTLMFQALKKAADRGVRVRLLLDDNNTKGLDHLLLSLNQHPNIEVRLYNPNRFRNIRMLGFVGDFRRLNRRMHNKSITADNQLSITGGRNIGDEYFAVEGSMLFADLDTLLLGEIVPQISRDFDRYWNSALAYPVDSIVTGRAATPAYLKDKMIEQRKKRKQFAEIEQRYLAALRRLDFIQQLQQNNLKLYWAEVQLLSDDPAKTQSRARQSGLIGPQINSAMGAPQRQLTIVSPYFVPTQPGADALIGMARRGVQIDIITNTISATDVKLVHSGYAKYRRQLLENGIHLYELKADGHTEGLRDTYITGNSGNSLHAKTFETDLERVFVGSFNFDPRSTHLNTEMGVVIQSPEFAQLVHDGLRNGLPTRTYQVTYKDHQLYWHTISDGRLISYDTEPDTRPWERVVLRLLAYLPIEWLL